MTQEEKQLVLLDLSARLSCGVICKTPKGDGHLCSVNQTIFGTEYGININPIKRDYFNDSEVKEQVIKPYLRPMSSMTEEEKKEYKEYFNSIEGKLIGFKGRVIWLMDWLLAHHFDYRDLIPMGLALEAKEGMYKTE